MLTTEVLKSLKKTNISVDKELTSTRVKALLKAASRAQKNEIDELAGVNRVSVNRVYATGALSARIAVAIAQVLNVSPFYLTGESDEAGEFDAATLKAFLDSKGYKDKVKLPVKRRPRVKAAKPEEVEEIDEAETETVQEDEPCGCCCEHEHEHEQDCGCNCHEMSEEEAVQLLRALYLRTKFSPESAKTLHRIQGLLS